MATLIGYSHGTVAWQATNATQPGDPTPAGYTAFNADGSVASTRALNAQEAAQLAAVDVSNTAAANQATLYQQAQNAMAGNRAYIGLTSPTNAQVAAQVKALTQQNNAIIRLILGQLDATN